MWRGCPCTDHMTLTNALGSARGVLTHSHAVLIAFDDIERVPKVPFCDVKDDVGLVGRVQRCDSPQKDDLCSK